jgi:O-antigen/teichoic acid export membrane protein
VVEDVLSEEPAVELLSSTEIFNAGQKDLEGRAVSATLWTVGAYGLSQSLRMANNLLLTHMLAPQYFGLMALSSTLVLGMVLLSDIGLMPSIINSPRGDEPLFLNTAWSVQIIRGFSLWLLCSLLAFPLAHLYGDNRIRLILPVLGLQMVFAGFNNIHMLRVARHMGVKRLLTIDLGAQVSATAITALLAWLYPSIWALVFGAIVSTAAKAILSHLPGVLPGHRNRLAWDQTAVTSLVHFGKWVLFGTAFYFFASNADRLILGKLVSLSLLGIYNIAFTIADIPRQVIQQFSNRVGLPFVAKLTQLPFPEFNRQVVRYRWMTLGAGGFILSLVVSAGGPLATHMYDARYQAASWIVPILALGLWHTLLYSTTSEILFALGKPKYSTFGTASFCVTICIALPLAFHFFGFRGAVISVAAGDLPIYFILAYAAKREKVTLFVQDAVATCGFVALVALEFALKHYLFS